jgi:DNA polymerase I
MAPDHELFLIDGNSLAYRAFFALPESIGTSDGRPTNAIYGLASMLVKVIAEHHPSGVVVAWDAGMSGREKTYDLYKAQRPSRPDLLAEQWPHLMPLVEAFGYTNVKVEGYEADDVIGALAMRAREEGIPVMVVSGDRDVYQLVGEGIRVMTTSRGITDTKVYDREGVVERYGVPPELVTDLIGLKGDTSDNIPGVPGIGEKTAAQLLQEFGSLEAVLENVDKVSGAKRKQNLVEHAEDARISKQLATLVCDIDTGVDLAEVMSSRPDRGALRDFMREFELRAVMERLEEALPEGEAVPGRSIERELSVEAVEGKPSDLAEGPVAVGVAAGRWAASDGERIVTGEEALDELAAALDGRPLAVHDAKSLGGGRHGLLAAAARQKIELGLEHDTLLAAYLIEPQRRTYELTELAADAGIGIAAPPSA